MDLQTVSSRKRKMRKKKKQLEKTATTTLCNEQDTNSSTVSKKLSKFHSLVKQLKHPSNCTVTKENENVLPVASIMSAKSQEPEVVIFTKRIPKQKDIQCENEVNELEISDSQKFIEFNLQRARREVMKFGISGLEKLDREEANIAHAISLGAKPRKGKYINYKALMEQKKREKQEMEQQKKIRAHLMLRKTGKRTASKKTKKKVHSKS